VLRVPNECIRQLLTAALKVCFVCVATDPEEHPQSELYWGHVNPIGPRACYDEAKRVAETMCYAYEKQVFDSMQLC